METDPGVSLEVVNNFTVNDLIADGTPGSSGLTIDDDGSSKTMTVNGGGTSVSGDFTINAGATVVTNFSSGKEIPGTLTNGGTFKISGDSIGVNTFTTSGTIDLGGDEATLAAATQSAIENNGTVEIGTQTDTIHVQDRLDVNSGGKLDLGNGTFIVEGDFSNEGNLESNSNALVAYDGGTNNTSSLLGDFSTQNTNPIPKLVVKSGTLDPADVLNEDDPDNNEVAVTDSLAVQSGAQYGEGDPGTGTSNEGADMKFKGDTFNVQGNLFVNEVRFSSNSTTTAGGAVFARVTVSGTTTLEISNNNFNVKGLVKINSDGTLDVSTNATTLKLFGDFLVDGTLDATGGTIAFVGGGDQTSCAFPDGNSAFPGDLNTCDTNNIQEIDAGSITFGTIIVDSTDTEVQFGSESNDIKVKGLLQVAKGNINLFRPFEMSGDLVVGTDGSVDFDNNSALKFVDGGPSINTSTVAELPKMTVEMGGANSTDDIVRIQNDVVLDTLKMHRGVLAFTNGAARLSINHTLRLGNPSNVTADATLDVNGSVANGIDVGSNPYETGTVELSSDGTQAVAGSNNDDASIRYVDDSGTAAASVNGKLTTRFRLGNNGFHFLSSPDNSGALTFNELLDRNNGQPDDSLFVKGVKGGDKGENIPGFATVQLWDESHIEDDADVTTSKLYTWKAIDCGRYSGWTEEYCEDAAGSNPNDPIYNGSVSYPSTNGLSDPMVHGRGYAIDAGATFDEPDASAPITLEQKFSPRENLSFDFLSDGPDMVGFRHDDNSIDPDFDGWNLIGNPYFSQMDWCGNPGISKNDLASAFYIWDPAAGAWEGYDCTTGNFGPTADSNNDKILDNGVIAPMQGFMVRVIGSSPTVSIDNIATAQKDGADAFISKSTGGSGLAPRVGLTLSTPEHGYRTNVAFVEGAELEADKQETLYRNGGPKYSPPTMYSVLDNGKAAVVNNLPQALSDSLSEADAETATVPLHVDGCDNGTAVSGMAEIQASNLRSLPTNWKVTLKDTETGKTTPLAESSTYSFELNGSCSTSKAATTASKTTQENQPPMPRPVTHSVAKDGSADTRFQLIIDPDGGSGDGSDDGSGSTGSATEINLGDLDIQTDGTDAKLAWSVSGTGEVGAIDLQHKFEEESSFETVTTIEGRTLSKQSTEQTVPLTEDQRKQYDLNAAGTHTFRLRAADGTVLDEVTKDFTALELSGEIGLTTYPNPVGDQATVEVLLEEKTDVTIGLYNTLGQKVRTIYNGSLRKKTFRLDAARLGSGLYFIRMKGDGVNATQRMTVVK